MTYLPVHLVNGKDKFIAVIASTDSFILIVFNASSEFQLKKNGTGTWYAKINIVYLD